MQNSGSKDNSISLKFVLSAFTVFLILIFYISNPGDLSKRKEKKSFEEMLEYNTYIKKEQVYIPQYVIEQQKKEFPIYNMPSITESNVIEAGKSDTILLPGDKVNLYNQLLDEFKNYPEQSELSLLNIMNKLLLFKGYPQNIISIKMIDKSNQDYNSINSYIFAQFNIFTGELLIDKDIFYKADITTIIAAIAHETDKFDKIARICKIIGIDEFKKIFYDNKVSVFNSGFWNIVSAYSNVENFEKDLYTNALKKLLEAKGMEVSPVYTIFYDISEKMRNPIILSAYMESDYVYDHFNVKREQSNAKIIADIFSEADKLIYNLVDVMRIPTHERIDIFDYVYAEALTSLMPDLEYKLKRCKKEKNGDLTEFWEEVQDKYNSFNKNGKLNQKTVDKIIKLLTLTKEHISKGISKSEVAEAISCKYNTLKSNIESSESLNNLRKTIVNYLKYTKQSNVYEPKEELNAILLLICLDNKEYLNNTQSKEIDIKEIIIPQEIRDIYKEEVKEGNELAFLYKNPILKENNTLWSRENKKLEGLIEKTRQGIKYNYK